MGSAFQRTGILAGSPRVVCDKRIAGVEDYVLIDPAELMLVPEIIRKCVAFIGCYDVNGKEHLLGTAFFVSRKTQESAHLYAVTARHIIDAIKNGEPINGIAIKRDKACLRVNLEGGQSRWIRKNINQWIPHPQDDPYVDVSVCKLDFEADFDHEPISIESINPANWPKPVGLQGKHFGIGDEVFFPGLFWSHYGTRRNIPIIRIGTIATMLEEHVATTKHGLIEAYLVEARSIAGMSGSPVFVALEGSNKVTGVYTNSAQEGVLGIEERLVRGAGMNMFMGLVHGHYGEDGDWRKAEVNYGIAIIVPGHKILEALNQETFTQREETQDREIRESRRPATIED